MGIRFFSKYTSAEGHTKTVESPGQLTASYDRTKRDPVKYPDTYLIPTPLQEGVNPEKTKHILTLEDAVQHMRESRPDILTEAFEDSVLGDTQRVTPATKVVKVTIKPTLLQRFHAFLLRWRFRIFKR